MRLAFSLLIVLAAASCKRAPATTVDYAAADGSFSARLPADWTVDERRGENRLASFFAPTKGADAETVSVSFFPAGGRWKTPREFAYWRATTGRATPIAESRVGQAPALEVTVDVPIASPHAGERIQRIRTIAFAAAGGFFALDRITDPERSGNDRAFEDFLSSFRARN